MANLEIAHYCDRCDKKLLRVAAYVEWCPECGSLYSGLTRQYTWSRLAKEMPLIEAENKK